MYMYKEHSEKNNFVEVNVHGLGSRSVTSPVIGSLVSDYYGLLRSR